MSNKDINSKWESYFENDRIKREKRAKLRRTDFEAYWKSIPSSVKLFSWTCVKIACYSAYAKGRFDEKYNQEG